MLICGQAEGVVVRPKWHCGCAIEVGGSVTKLGQDPQRCGDRVRSEVIAGSTAGLCDHQRSGGRFHGGVVCGHVGVQLRGRSGSVDLWLRRRWWRDMCMVEVGVRLCG